MNTEKIKDLVNAICALNEENNIYKDTHIFENQEDDELLDIMARPVSTQLWRKLHDRKNSYGTISTDVNNLRYKGRSEDDLEKYRLKGLKKISEKTDPLKKIDVFYEYAYELKESIKMLDFMDYVTNETKMVVSFDVCLNMINLEKYTLSEIKANMPWLKLSDIYGLSKMCGKEIIPSVEEFLTIKDEYYKSGSPAILSDIFGPVVNS